MPENETCMYVCIYLCLVNLSSLKHRFKEKGPPEMSHLALFSVEFSVVFR